MDSHRSHPGALRDLLNDYVLTHLTVDHREATESLVYDILSNALVPVPTTDPYFSTLPSDPFDDLLKSLTYDPFISPFEEKIETIVDKGAFRFIQKTLNFRGETKTQRCWQDNALLELEETCSASKDTVLSLRAIREMPSSASSSSATKCLPKTISDILKCNRIKSVAEQEFTDQVTSIDDVLDVQLEIDAKTRKAALALLCDNPFAKRMNNIPRQAARTEPWLQPPSPSLPIIYPQTPPLFSRVHAPHGSKGTHIQSITDLPSVMVSISVDSELDVPERHMAIINGWQTFSSVSPSSTPSSVGSNSEVDELWCPSSETEPLVINELENAKFDDVVMPLRPSLRDTGEIPVYIGERESLASFIKSHAINSIQPKASKTSAVPSPSPTSGIETSIQGHPDTGSGPTNFDPEGLLFSSSELDQDIRSLYSTLSKGAHDIMYLEQLESSHIDLMNVPRLPPPNEHNTPSFPHDLASLICKNKDRGNSSSVSPSEFGVLQKAKGVKSLNIELSWRPFKFQSRVPTHEELADVIALQDISPHQADLDADNSPVRHLIERNEFSDSRSILPKIDEALICRNACRDDILVPNQGDNENGLRVIFNWEERRRLVRLSNERVVEVDNANVESRPCMEHANCDEEARPRNVEGALNKDQEVPYDLADCQQARVDDSGIAMDFSYVNNDSLCREADFSSILPYEHNYSAPSSVILDEVADLFVSSLEVWDTGQEAPAGSFIPLTQESSRPFEADAVTSQFEPLSTQDADPPGRDWFAESASSNLPASSIPSDGTPSVSNVDPMRSTMMPHPEMLDNALAAGLVHSRRESARQSLADFMKLRAKAQDDSPDVVADLPSDEIDPETVLENIDSSPICTVPPEVIDRHTLCLTPESALPSVSHRYLASIEFIQKRQIALALCSSKLKVELIERDALDGADLILDYDTAVLFFSLFALPSQLSALQSRLEFLSWRYLYVLVVLEAYTPSLSYRSGDVGRLAPLAFTPPVLKAIKKLRRDLAIAEGYFTKCPDSEIQFAFALSVDEAAMYSRTFGDYAAQRSVPEIWGERLWLDEAVEGEKELMNADGMNAFTSAMILSQLPLNAFLEMSPEGRINAFAQSMGQDRIVKFNEYIASRYDIIRSTTTSPSPMDVSADA